MIALFLILLIVVLGATFGVSGVIIIIASAIGLLFFFCIKWSIEEKQKEKERSARQAVEQDNRKLRNFYQMCKKAGVTAIQSEEDLQIITQIAGTMQLGDADAKTFFLEASALAQKERRSRVGNVENRGTSKVCGVGKIRRLFRTREATCDAA